MRFFAALIFALITLTSTAQEKVDTLSVFIPNAFTPNGDGNNDYFQPYFSSTELSIVSFEMIIFNRNGCIMYHVYDLNQPWDGGASTHDYFDTPSEVYVYFIKATFSNKKTYIYRGKIVRIN